MPPIPVIVVLCVIGLMVYVMLSCAIGVTAVWFHWRKLNRDQALRALKSWDVGSGVGFRPLTEYERNRGYTIAQGDPTVWFMWAAICWPVFCVIFAAFGVVLGVVFAIAGIGYGPFWVCRGVVRYLASSLMTNDQAEVTSAT